MKASSPTQKWVKLFSVLATLTVIISLVSSLGKTISVSAASLPGGTRSSSAPSFGPYTAYMPLSVQKYPAVTIFGATLNGKTEIALDYMSNAGMSWTRINLSWPAVEPTQGARDWSAVGAQETQIIQATAKHVNVILTIADTPTWALKTGASCGPVLPAKLSALQAFMRDLVNRYKVSPYSVRYFEMFNEPDAAYAMGCWGDESDPYYGGGYYGEMLKTIYPAVKAAQSDAQVLVGGLLMDCDPNNPPAGKTCKPSYFLEGILRDGAGNSFDGISYHSYEYYDLAVGHYSSTNWASAWNTTGPVVIAKTNFLRSVLDQYGFGSKYLISTEAGLLSGDLGEQFQLTKAYYVPEIYATSFALNIRGNLWYSAYGWRGSGLLDANTDQPLPAYNAYQVAYKEFLGASYVGPIGQSGLFGYKFKKGTVEMWVAWSKDGAQHDLTLPKVPIVIHDVWGGSQTISTTVYPVGVQPVYIEMAQ